MTGELPGSDPVESATPAPKATPQEGADAARVDELAAQRATAEAQNAADRGGIAAEVMTPLTEKSREIEAKRDALVVLVEKYLGKEGTAGSIEKKAPKAKDSLAKARVSFETARAEVDAKLATAKQLEAQGKFAEAEVAFGEARAAVDKALALLKPPKYEDPAWNEEQAFRLIYGDAAELLDSMRAEGTTEGQALATMIQAKETALGNLARPKPATPPAPDAPAAPVGPDPKKVAQTDVLKALSGSSSPSKTVGTLITQSEVFMRDAPGWDWWNSDIKTQAQSKLAPLTTIQGTVERMVASVTSDVNTGAYPTAQEKLAALAEYVETEIGKMASDLEIVHPSMFDSLGAQLQQGIRDIRTWCDTQSSKLVEAPTPETPAAAAVASTEAPPAGSESGPAEGAETAEETKEREAVQAVTGFAKDAFEAVKKGDFVSAGLAMLSAIFTVLYYEGDMMSLVAKSWEVIKPLVQSDAELKETATELTSVSGVFRQLGFRRPSVYNGILAIPMATVARYAKNPNDTSLDAAQKDKLEAFAASEGADEFFDVLLKPAEGESGGGNGGEKYADPAMASSTDTVKSFINAQLEAKTWRMPPAESSE